MTGSRSNVRLGLVGAGRWGRNYVRTITALDGVVLARIASRNPETGSLVGADCVVVADWRAVAEADDLDGVVVATPPAQHAEIVCAAVAAGRAVLVEKPLTLDLGEARALRRFVGEHAGFVMVDHIHLFHPAYRALKATGRRLGAIRQIAAAAGNRGAYRDDAPVLWDWGCHDVALCLDLMGTPPETVDAERIEARSTAAGYGENIALRLRFSLQACEQLRMRWTRIHRNL